MTKSELIDYIVTQQDQLPPRDVEIAVKMILERMTHALVNNDRITPKLVIRLSCRVNMYLISNLAKSFVNALTAVSRQVESVGPMTR